MKIKIEKRKINKELFPRKAKIILIFEDGIVIHGDGQVDGRKYDKRDKEVIFTATLLKDL